MRKYILIHLVLLLVSTTTYAGSLLSTSGFGGENGNGAVVGYDVSKKQITPPLFGQDLTLLVRPQPNTKK